MMRAIHGAALTLVLGLSAPAWAQRANFTWDIPKTVSVVDVPGQVDANGVPVKLLAVRSKEKAQVILQSVVDRFQSWGFSVDEAYKQPQLLREPMVTGLDTRNFISYTAILQVNPDGTTTVFLGQANLGAAKAPQPAGLPVFPGGSGVLTAQTEGSHTVSYSVPGRTTADVEAFYREVLTKAGFKEIQPRVFKSSTEEVSLTLGVTKDGPVAVRLVRRAAAADDDMRPGE
ncbi:MULTISPECIES: hypothetical protein [unclassified Corallococcus]|uniref:hypothetical protein n=1 Tax=unclassified Corallococcus TaxID=2685029 RepID=UPI001A8C11F1|nr:MULTISPECIES: hypothetical protein [unclassified Corallococcus]MBN9681884.1 hypothetical protein [Corallococcus sp. NCSPR001]WAS86549.1 hypothetical protein O0N60_06125 [Corallococcus sp. NCRR]